MNALPAGWGWPGNSRKAHYFDEGQATSICGRWLFSGSREPDNGKRSPDDCAECHKRLGRRKAKTFKFSTR